MKLHISMSMIVRLSALRKGRIGTVVRASDYGPRGPWFEFPPLLSSLLP